MTIETILPTPNLMKARRILCIQPHYDDNDIAAAGTLSLLRENGAELFYVTATDDLMGVVDPSLSDEAARKALRRDQFAAGEVIGVMEQHWLGYPDAGDYDYFALRRDLLKYIRIIRPDFVFSADPWLTYEAHRDHIQTGLAAAEAVMFAGLTRIASSDPAADESYSGHEIKGIVFYYTREPNLVVDVGGTWEKKIAAVRCYETQFSANEMNQLVQALEAKSQQVAAPESFARGEALKVLHTSALHCGF